MSYLEWVVWFVTEYVIPTSILVIIVLAFALFACILYDMLGGRR